MSLSIKKFNENDEKIKEIDKKDISKIKKENIKLKIKILDNNIISLEKALKLKNKNLLEMKLENERKSYKNKLSILKEQYKFVIQKYKKKIQTLKIKLINCEKKYINIKKFDENIYNEDLDFQNQKIKLLDELIEYRGLLSNFNSNDEKDEEYSNNVFSDDISTNIGFQIWIVTNSKKFLKIGTLLNIDIRIFNFFIHSIKLQSSGYHWRIRYDKR